MIGTCPSQDDGARYVMRGDIVDMVIDSDAAVYYTVYFVGYPKLYATIAPCLPEGAVTRFNMALLESPDDRDGWFFPELRKAIAAYEDVELDETTLLPKWRSAQVPHAVDATASDDESEADTTNGHHVIDGDDDDDDDGDGDEVKVIDGGADRGGGGVIADEGADKAKEREKPAANGPTHTAKMVSMPPSLPSLPSPSPKKRRLQQADPLEGAGSRVTRSCALVPGKRLRERK